jgi:hypothetical protein
MWLRNCFIYGFVRISSCRNRHLPSLLSSSFFELLLNLPPNRHGVLSQSLTSLIPRFFVTYINPPITAAFLHQKTPWWFQFSNFINNALCNETFLALEPGSEIDPLLTLDEEAILFVARMTVNCSATPAKNIIVMWMFRPSLLRRGKKWSLG